MPKSGPTIFLLASALFLAHAAGCAGPTPSPDPTSAPAPVPTPAAGAAAPAPSALAPSPAAVGDAASSRGAPLDREALVAQAVADAAARAGVPPDGVRIVSVDAREWPNSGLGCPKPGTAYAQVITPGYLIVVEAAGRSFEYHTDRARSELCPR